MLRTPDARFDALPGYPFAPRYAEVDGGALGALRVHHVDERPAGWDPVSGETVLMLHGEPTWSYLYRRVVPRVVAAGHRAVAPDLVGFGRSDKPSRVDDYSYAGHVRWMAEWMERVGLTGGVTLLCQDWGSLIGLRLVAEYPERFRRVVTANAALPDGSGPVPAAFRAWQRFARWSPWFPIGRIVAQGCVRRVAPEVRAAYDAPFPTAAYKAGARAFPRLVPTTPDDPAVPDQRRAWASLERFDRPFLTAFSDKDPIMAGNDRIFQRRVPGARGRAHTTIRDGGHFLQEDAGEALGDVVVRFIADTPAPVAAAA